MCMGSASAIRRRSIIFVVALAGLLIAVATAMGYLQRTVNGPASVVPGHVYTFYVSGFSPGEAIYPSVQPISCARSSERCVQDPCPSCALTRTGGSGTATVRFRWPRRSFYVFANMLLAHYLARLPPMSKRSTVSSGVLMELHGAREHPRVARDSPR